MSDNKTIAKNTVYLYVRMLVTMVIALYTSRVVLQKLGVDDFGIYQAVGGVVGFLSFINSALATGSSRFLTYELGKGSFERLKKTFTSTFTVHILIAFIIVLVSETIGIWFVLNKMSFPNERFDAAVYAYHISIVTIIFSIIRVPLHAVIIAHERMSFYAYVSIIEAFLQLVICYLLGVGNSDRLVFYSSLLCGIQFLLFFVYGFYCKRHFLECRYSLNLDKDILKPILSFSGWSLYANGSIAFSNQGILTLLNLFFAPAIVSARAISLQVINAANLLVSNFRTAVNPQIVKKLAQGDNEGSMGLLLQSTKFSYFLMLLIALPVFFLTDPLLNLWLGDNVPDFTSIFLKLGVIQSLFQVFDTSFYTALYAKGRLKENALISPSVVFIVFPIIYVLFKVGCSPVVLSWAYLLCYAFLAFFVKPLLIVKIANYMWADIFRLFFSCIKVTIISLPLPVFFNYVLYNSLDTFYGIIIMIVVCVLSILCASWYLGIDASMKVKIMCFIRRKLYV